MSAPTTPTRTSPDLTGASWMAAPYEDLSFLDSPTKTPSRTPGHSVSASTEKPAVPEIKAGWFDDDDIPFPSRKSTPEKTASKVSKVARRLEDDFSDGEEGWFSEKASEEVSPPSATETPPKLRSLKRRFADLDPDADIIGPQEKREFEEGLISLKELIDSPMKKKRSTEVRNIHSIFVKKVTKGAADLIEKHEQLIGSLKMTPFFGMLLGKLNEIDAACEFPALELPKPLLPVNYKHIVEPVVYTTTETKETKSLGWHFCTAEYFPMLRNPVHSISGVFSATYAVKGAKDKRSSFFPLSITSVEILDDYIQSSQLCSEDENRALYRIPGLNIYFEAIKKFGSLHSAYPLLHVQNWEENKDFLIFVGQPALTSQQIFDAARKVMSDYAHRGPLSTQTSPIRYFSQDGSQVYIEIAPELVGNLGILQGILFVFDRNLFADLENQFDQMDVDTDR